VKGPIAVQLFWKARSLAHRELHMAREAGCCHRVAIIPLPRDHLVLVTEEAAPFRTNLHREIQVLHCCRCSSNPEIAHNCFRIPHARINPYRHIRAKIGCLREKSRAHCCNAVSEGCARRSAFEEAIGRNPERLRVARRAK